MHRPNLIGFFPVILKHLYDADIVEEDAILMWAGEEGRSEEFTPASLTDEQIEELHAKAMPFVTWLEEADEEGEEVGITPVFSRRFVVRLSKMAGCNEHVCSCHTNWGLTQ